MLDMSLLIRSIERRFEIRDYQTDVVQIRSDDLSPLLLTCSVRVQPAFQQARKSAESPGNGLWAPWSPNARADAARP